MTRDDGDVGDSGDSTLNNPTHPRSTPKNKDLDDSTPGIPFFNPATSMQFVL
jgi:hypothetical protein